MTLRDVYEWGKQKLREVDIDDAPYDAWYLLEYVTGMNRTEYFLRMNEELTSDLEEQYKTVIEIRQKHIPLQHITKEQEFMGLTFYVNEHVLVPRQDTEVLVESALEVLKPGMKLLDMCTGSGCILISLLHRVKGVSGVGTDISEKALEVAKKNAVKIGVEAQFYESDLFEKMEGQYNLIVSNPPYIRTGVIEELQDEVKLHDPYIALDGKEDGLYFYRRIVEKAPCHLKSGGYLYFEIGYDQGASVKQLMEKAGFQNVTVKKDLAGLDRVVFGVYI